MKRLNILCKWRMLFAGWQLGTRSNQDPEANAVRDHRESTIIQRCELTALTALLVQKGVFTAEEFTAAIEDEATKLDADYSERFPGIYAGEDGLIFTQQAVTTMKRMNFKP